jgi:Yip1-like protein
MSAMPPVASAATPRSLVDRVKAILLEPRSEWTVIANESATIGSLYRYAAILAAIPAICGAIAIFRIGSSLASVGIAGNSAAWAIQFAIVRYISALIGIYVLALVIDALAPQFGGQKSQIQALKVATYSCTAAWVAGVFVLIPWIGWILGLLGLYSLYLLYLGLPIVMKAPADKALGYTVVTIIAAIVIFVLLGWIGHLLGGSPMYGM